LTGELTGRSLKCHDNVYTTTLYSVPCALGLDGELAAALETHADLCRITTSAVGTIKCEPITLWWLFDYITQETINLPYYERLKMLERRVYELQMNPGTNSVARHFRVIPFTICDNLQQLNDLDALWLTMGYEGTIIRDPQGKYKQGRSTIKEGGLLRIKRFIQEEGTVLSIEEGVTNNNPAQINELGKTFRSSHKENMIPNGLIANMMVRVHKDIYDPQDKKKLLIKKDQVIKVSAGRLTAKQKAEYFKDPSKILGRVIKFNFFPKGHKDEPRFPTFQLFKADSDIGVE
jgi:DNA ligase-1